MMEEEDKIVQKTSRIRLIKDKMAGSMMLTFTLVSVLLVVLIGIVYLPLIYPDGFRPDLPDYER